MEVAAIAFSSQPPLPFEDVVIVMTKTFDLMKMILVMMVVTLVVVMVLMVMIATPFPGHDVMINQDLA